VQKTARYRGNNWLSYINLKHPVEIYPLEGEAEYFSLPDDHFLKKSNRNDRRCTCPEHQASREENNCNWGWPW